MPVLILLTLGALCECHSERWPSSKTFFRKGAGELGVVRPAISVSGVSWLECPESSPQSHKELSAKVLWLGKVCRRLWERRMK